MNTLAAIITHLEAHADLTALVGTRLAAKHKFGTGAADAWAKPSKAITVAQSGGDPDIDTAMQRIRLEVRCYGERPREAAKVYDALVGVMRNFTRTTVAITGGTALIYYLVPDSGPDAIFDIDLDLDYIQVFLRTAVAEIAVA